MPMAERHPPQARIAVRALMCESDLSAQQIAAQTGIPYPTVCKWNQLHGWRPSATRVLRTLRPERFSPERILAIGRVFEVEGVDPGDLAAAIGTRRETAEAFFRACGFPQDVRRAPRDERPGEALRTALRFHVARQIAAFDAELTVRTRRPRAGARLTRAAEPAKPLDSAKLLRDLAGLKRLLDDLDAEAQPEPRTDRWGRPIEDAPEPDLDALRERIARRYEAFSAARDAERAAAADEGGDGEAGLAGEDVPDPAPAAAGAGPSIRSLSP